MLGNVLVVSKCVTTLIPDKLYAVTRGAAPPSLLKIDVSPFYLCFTLRQLC